MIEKSTQVTPPDRSTSGSLDVRLPFPEDFFPNKLDKVSLFLQRFVGSTSEKLLTAVGVLEPRGRFEKEAHPWEEFVSGLPRLERNMCGFSSQEVKQENKPTPEELVDIFRRALDAIPPTKDTLVFFNDVHIPVSSLVVCTEKEYKANPDATKAYLLICDEDENETYLDTAFTKHLEYQPNVVGSFGWFSQDREGYSLAFGGDHLAFDGKLIVKIMDSVLSSLKTEPLEVETATRFVAGDRNCITYTTSTPLSVKSISLKIADFIRKHEGKEKEMVSMTVPVLTSVTRKDNGQEITIERLGQAHCHISTKTSELEFSKQLLESKKRAETGSGVSEVWLRLVSPKNRILRKAATFLQGIPLGKRAYQILIGDIIFSPLPTKLPVAATTSISGETAVNVTLTGDNRQITVSGNSDYWPMDELHELINSLVEKKAHRETSH